MDLPAALWAAAWGDAGTIGGFKSGDGLAAPVGTSGAMVAAAADADADADALARGFVIAGSSAGLLDRTKRTTATAAMATPPPTSPITNPDLPPPRLRGAAIMGAGAAAIALAFDAAMPT